MRIKKSWLIAAIVLILVACAAQQRTLDCECGNVRLECTYGEAIYVIPSATCPSDISQPVSTCITLENGESVCTTDVPPALAGTADTSTDEGESEQPEPEPALTCTFSPQPAPEGYEGDEAELYCWDCSDFSQGCSEAYQEAYQSNDPVQ